MRRTRIETENYPGESDDCREESGDRHRVIPGSLATKLIIELISSNSLVAKLPVAPRCWICLRLCHGNSSQTD